MRAGRRIEHLLLRLWERFCGRQIVQALLGCGSPFEGVSDPLSGPDDPFLHSYAAMLPEKSALSVTLWSVEETRIDVHSQFW